MNRAGSSPYGCSKAPEMATEIWAKELVKPAYSQYRQPGSRSEHARHGDGNARALAAAAVPLLVNLTTWWRLWLFVVSHAADGVNGFRLTRTTGTKIDPANDQTGRLCADPKAAGPQLNSVGPVACLCRTAADARTPGAANHVAYKCLSPDGFLVPAGQRQDASNWGCDPI